MINVQVKNHENVKKNLQLFEICSNLKVGFFHYRKCFT